MRINNKRYKIRWGRVALLLLCLAAVVALLWGAVAGVMHLLSDDDESQPVTDSTVVTLTTEQIAAMQAMHHRLDSFMHQPMRLDTNLISISVYDATTQQPVYNYRQDELRAPASCMKIATAIAAVKRLGMNYRYRESLQVRGKMRGDTLVGNVLLRADDDPLFESFEGFAKRLRASGVHHVRGNIYLDLARRDTLRPHPTAKAWDIAYHRTPLLMKGQRYIDRHLRAQLRMAGITIRNDASVRPQGRYRVVAAASHRLTDVITPMMIHSSNIKAEAVFYHLDHKLGFAPDRRMRWQTPHATEQFLRETFSADSTDTMKGFVFNDGSGLSPQNLLSASFLVDMLRYAYADKSLRDYFINEALATPGDAVRRGSLLTRLSQPQYRGRIFCKTGTLTTIGASSLAGYLHASDGHWYIFAIINNDSPVAESRIFQDKICKVMKTHPLTPSR